MITPTLIKIFFKEVLSFRHLDRVCEPDLIMEDPQQVKEYTQSGLEGGVMAPIYLFYTAQICEVIQPGDRVLDLACGPANQLAQVARLNPDCHFVGLDLSLEMLDRARELAAAQHLDNIEFVHGSVTDLSAFADHSFNAIMSTMALHHLPQTADLDQTFAEAARVLAPGGGMYIVDFGRMKLKSSIEYFAYQYKDRQPPLFTIDYLNSLYAAFSLADFQHACYSAFGINGSPKVFSTWRVPYMVAIKTPPRRRLDGELLNRLQQLHAALPDYHKTDFADFKAFFGLGGVRSPI